MCSESVTELFFSLPSFYPGVTDRSDNSSASAAGTRSCTVHIFLQEEVRTVICIILPIALICGGCATLMTDIYNYLFRQ